MSKICTSTFSLEDVILKLTVSFAGFGTASETID
jgi:hypothetical protein